MAQKTTVQPQTFLSRTSTRAFVFVVVIVLIHFFFKETVGEKKAMCGSLAKCDDSSTTTDDVLIRVEQRGLHT